MTKTLFLILLSCTLALSVNAQTTKTAVLKQERLAYAPANFHISSIADDRADKTKIGNIGRDKLVLQGGVLESFKTLTSKYITQNKSTQPIGIHIVKLNFDVKPVRNGWMAYAEMTLAYYAGEDLLIEFSGKGQKEIDDNPVEYVDEFVKKSMESSLKKFDSWWAQNKGRVATSPVVQVNVSLGRTCDKPDCIAYTASRPLTIADFQGVPQENGIELAATASGTDIKYEAETRNGQIVLTVVLTPYFSKTASWFKKGGKHPDEVLLHEQTHFNIKAIKVCELVEKIKRTTFLKETFEAQLQELMNRNADDNAAAQDQFDGETNHGIIRDKELEWEKKVSEKVKTVGCY